MFGSKTRPNPMAYRYEREADPEHYSNGSRGPEDDHDLGQYRGADIIHPKMERWHHREFLGTNSYASWLALACFLVSFGVVINNTAQPANAEPRVATGMVILGILVILWASAVFWKANWEIQPKAAMAALMVLVLCFIILAIWLAVRIWL
jgi:hypothetical protein